MFCFTQDLGTLACLRMWEHFVGMAFIASTALAVAFGPIIVSAALAWVDR